jgi:hypothetical protein
MTTIDKSRALYAICCILVGGSLSACARESRPTIATRGAQSVVFVDGRGTVKSPNLRIQCGPSVPAPSNRCIGEAGTPSEPRLIAEPEPGWEFDHWETRRLDAWCDPTFVYAGADPQGGPTYSYTAVFAPRRDTASR